MPSEKFALALEDKNWLQASKLLDNHEDISEYLQPNNHKLHDVIVDGYHAHLAEISRKNTHLLFENYGDLYVEEDVANEPIVKFIEQLILLGFNLLFVNDGHTTFDRLRIASPILGNHLAEFINSPKTVNGLNRIRLLALFDSQCRSKKLQKLAIPREINVRTAEMLGVPLPKPRITLE
jgi:hypothetical protein